MGLASIFENFSLVFNCFLPSNKKMKQRFEINKNLLELGEKYNISTLPVLIGKEITDLYPITDQVHKWNIFIVGKKKNYIMAHTFDLDIGVDQSELLNRQADPYLGKELNDFFNPVWDKTLEGNDLQFFMLWSGKTYFVNTYVLSNGTRDVIGAIMFIRAVEVLPMFSSGEQEKQEKKNSFDYAVQHSSTFVKQPI